MGATMKNLAEEISLKEKALFKLQATDKEIDVFPDNQVKIHTRQGVDKEYTA